MRLVVLCLFSTLLAMGSLALADDAPDKPEPPVRLKKKNRPANDDAGKVPPAAGPGPEAAGRRVRCLRLQTFRGQATGLARPAPAAGPRQPARFQESNRQGKKPGTGQPTTGPDGEGWGRGEARRRQRRPARGKQARRCV